MILVLSHAHFLPPGVWEDVMWGNPREGRLGVLSKSVEFVLKHDDAVMYLCSGVPVAGGREFSPNSKRFMVKHHAELPAFQGLGTGEARDRLFSLLQKIIYFDEVAQNTREEIARAAEHCKGLQIDKVLAVTAPKHAPRVLQELLIARANGHFCGSDIFVTASDVDFPNATAADVSILERSHRHDTPSVAANLNAMGDAIITLLRQRELPEFARFTEAFKRLVESFGIKANW